MPARHDPDSAYESGDTRAQAGTRELTLELTRDSIRAAFASSYAEARSLFLNAAAEAGLAVQSELHPLRGIDGEPLAIDAVRDGLTGASRLLVISSGCHGVEGLGGSGAQVALLRDAALREQAHAHGVAVLHLHALNPHGFSWGRRVTHENVDLNRNFPDFSRPLPRNPGYDRLAALLVPERWPPPWHEKLTLAGFIARHGLRALKAAVSGGQYTHPDGLFYGGQAPSWSHLRVRALLREHGAGIERLGWIDLHSGLGPMGVGERILACPEDADTVARARRWWGAQLTSMHDGSSSSAPLTGLMWQAAREECPQAEYTGIGLEFGTVPSSVVMRALRADHWMHQRLRLHLQVDDAQREAIRRQMREAFYIDRDDWKLRVVEQTFDAVRQAVDGLAEPMLVRN